MKKDNTRDYITSAFRLYAKWGERSANEVKDILDGSDADTPPSELEAMLRDIDAVDRAIKLLSDAGHTEMIDAVRAIYFYRAKSPMRSGEISDRVRRYAYEAHYCEKEVYRMLREVRLLTAGIRGLRTE